MVIAGRSVHQMIRFFLGKLEQAVNQYFVHMLSLVNNNNPTREENDRRINFIINLLESMGPGRD